MTLVFTLKKGACTFSTLCFAATILTPMSAYAQQKAENEEAAASDEIVVTATRRDLKLGDVPLSISALSQDTLTTLGIRDSKDIAYAVPGLSVITDNSGGDQINIRGVVAIGSSPTTSFYIDETPISQIGGGYFNPRYFDIERVEVLRGPQGTLFGASSMGGGIRVITKRPNLNNFQATVRGEGSSTRLGSENYTLDGAVSVPIIDDVLALRVTGFYEKQAGWVKGFTPIFSDNPLDYIIFDPNTGAPAGVGIAYKGFTGTGKRVGDQTIYGGRASLLFQPTDALKLTATYHRQQRNNDGLNIANNSASLGLSGTELRQASTFPGYRNRLSQLANLTVEFDYGFADLISSSSYQWSNEDRLVDFSVFLVPLGVAQLGLPLGVVPRDANGQAGSPFFGRQKSKDFTQEIRLVSSGDGPFNWIVGAFYNKSKNFQNQDVQLRGLTALAAANPTIPVPIPNDSYALTTLDDRSREISFFGEVGYKFNDAFSANFGIRRYDVELQSRSGASGLFPLLERGSLIVANPSVKTRERGLTYKVGLKYKPNTDLMLFANYTTGYRPGGTNEAGLGVPSGFKSDKLAQYELGLKSSWLDRTLSVNGAVFYIDWSDIPTVVITPGGLSYNINGPKARNYGAELEVTMRPTKGLEASVNLTVLNAQYSQQFTDTTGNRIVINKGDRLPNVPDVTLNASINYGWSIGDNSNARIGANVSHVTKRSQFINDTGSLLPGFVNAGLSAGVDFGKFDVSVFARNVFDSRALVGNFATGVDISNGVPGSFNRQSFLQPRTIGAAVQVKF